MNEEKTPEDLRRLHKAAVEDRLHAVAKVKQIAKALRKLASAIDRKPDFEAVSTDSILQEYLDLSRIGALVAEERELSIKQDDYEVRLRALGLDPFA